jgi:hypothetical protein
MWIMRYAVTGAIASIALLGAVSMAVAQGRGDREGRAGNSGASAAQRSERPAMRAPRAQPSVRERRSSSGRERAAPERRFTRERQAEPRARVQRERQQTERRREQRAAQQRRNEQRRTEQRQAEERRRERSAEQRREVQGKEQRTTQRPDQDAARQDVKRVQASDEQRSRVRERLFREHRADRNRDRDRIRGIRPIVGVHIPRRHRLHRLPVWVIEYAPIYRNYSYVWIEDTICIVDPATYVVVDVLPAYSQRAEIRDLTLTPQQMRFVYAEVPKDTSVDVRIRLALGAEIPRDVALYTFPDHVLARIPKLESYRYVVVDDDVAIVDPADHAVVLVIEE